MRIPGHSDGRFSHGPGGRAGPAGALRRSASESDGRAQLRDGPAVFLVPAR